MSATLVCITSYIQCCFFEFLVVAITPLTNLLFELYLSVKLVPSVKLSNVTHVPII